jgi:histidinol-phosphate aminotransferase
LQKIDEVNEWTRQTIDQRHWLEEELKTIGYVQKIYPSDANFLLVNMENANDVFKYLQEKGIIVRNRSNVIGCEDCLRITVGTEDENRSLMIALKEFEN